MPLYVCEYSLSVCGCVESVRVLRELYIGEREREEREGKGHEFMSGKAKGR